MKRIPVRVGYGHDGELDFEVPNAVVVNPHHKDGMHPHYADAGELLRCYPEGSKIHVEFSLLPEGTPGAKWRWSEEAWVEVP